MDYSSLPHDPEHPVGSSPWGSTSPRTDRTFPASDVPPSPLPPHQSPYGADRERQQDEESTTQDLSERLQGSQIEDQVHREHHPHPPANSEQQPQHRAQVSARYQTGARNKARPSAPQYKLQAKITGLERTGKKDPILRFDVHVRPTHCHLRILRFWLTLIVITDEHTKVSNNTIPRRSSNPLRVCQAC